MTRTLRYFCACLLLAACGDDTSTLRVDVRTDYVPGVEFAEVEVGFDESGTELTYPVRFGEDFLRGIRVAELEASPGQRTLRARVNAADGRRIAERRLELDLSGDATTVTVIFTRGCEGVSCPDGSGDSEATQCVGGRCVRPECTPENPEACSEGCSSADECPSDVAGCARAICDEGTCYVGSELGACATGEFCHPERGCIPEPEEMDGAVLPADMGMPSDGGGETDMFTDPSCGQPCDTGNPCELGTFDCSSGTPVCTAGGPADSGTECRPAASECDVAEVCDGTSTTCPTDELADTGTVCSEGFCDGLGACGDCEPGAACSTGNPCEVGETRCEGGVPVCERASDVPAGVSCGADMTSTWSSCGGFSNDCDTTGTQSRSVTTFECNGSGSCQSLGSIEMRACSRVTAGSPCGAIREEGRFGACGGFGFICDETGTQSRTVTDYACNSAGSCIGTGSTEERSCTRDTDGTTCMDDDPGSWGGCIVDTRSDPCAETGTQSRTLTAYACVGGSCTGSSSMETRGCSVDSNGRSCPSPLAPNFPCANYACDSSANCALSSTTCFGGQLCCFSGCQFPGGMEICFD